MHSTNFDTLTYAKKLQEAGFTSEQAEGLRAVVDENLATKQDLKELETRLVHAIEELRQDTKHDIEELRQSTKHDIELVRRDMKEMESRIVLRLGGILVAGFTIVVAMIGVVIALVGL